MNKKVIVEICVESLESAIAAQESGADRIELCSDLLEGGLTPSAGLIKLVVNTLKIPVNVLIRPRSGDFFYSDYEFIVMKEDVKLAKELKANGVVFGILNTDGTIDKDRTRELIELARPMKITFHRAFDMTRDPMEALDNLIELGVDRILTSGQKGSAYDGRELIKELVIRAEERITIMPGGGINASNAKQIIEKCSVLQIHSSASEKVLSRMVYRNPKAFMGKGDSLSEYELRVASATKIKSLVEAVK